jgi:hypothetical protein
VDIGEEGSGVLAPGVNAFLQALDLKAVGPSIVYDIPAEGSIEQGERDCGVGAHLLGIAFCVGGNAFYGAGGADFAQDGRKALTKGNVTAAALVPGDEHLVQLLDQVWVLGWNWLGGCQAAIKIDIGYHYELLTNSAY